MRQDPGGAGHWDDLARRTVSACILATVGAAAVIFGGVSFSLFVALLAAVIFWELGIMFGAQTVVLAAIGGVGVFLISLATPMLSLVIVLAGTCLAFFSANQMRQGIMIPAFLVLTAAWAIIAFRGEFGAAWMFWLAFVVVFSDIAGYFAGRLIGGPKFMPSISPKKTWSGTIAGWVCAALIGTAFSVFLAAPPRLIWISVLVAFAGQMGDIAESAMKRRSGVKDSGKILPGHGGIYDRFDSMIGAALCVAVLNWIGAIDPGSVA